jgi:hypothetical protein
MKKSTFAFAAFTQLYCWQIGCGNEAPSIAPDGGSDASQLGQDPSGLSVLLPDGSVVEIVDGGAGCPTGQFGSDGNAASCASAGACPAGTLMSAPATSTSDAVCELAPACGEAIQPGSYWTMCAPNEIQLIPSSGGFSATDYCTAGDIFPSTTQIENGALFLTGPRPAGSVNWTGGPGITGFPKGDAVLDLPASALVVSVNALAPGGRFCISPHSVTFNYADNTIAMASVSVPHDCDCENVTGTNATSTCLGAISTVCCPYWYENSFQNPFPGLVVSSIVYRYGACDESLISDGEVWAVSVRLVN